jgi:hypothetical protein
MELIIPEVPNKPAVYKLTFDAHWFYIGSSENVRRRFVRWKCTLKLGKHFKSINIKQILPTTNVIEFSIVEFATDKATVRDRENYYLSLYDGDMLLNRCPDAYTPKGMRPYFGYVKKKKQPRGGAVSPHKPIAQFDKSGKAIAVFQSILAASRALKIKDSAIRHILKGQSGTAKKSTFKLILPDGSYIDPPKFIRKPTSKAVIDNLKGKYVGGLSPRAKKVSMYSLDGKFIKTFDAVRDAARAVGVNSQNIQSVLRGDRPTSKGYIWKYAP